MVHATDMCVRSCVCLQCAQVDFGGEPGGPVLAHECRYPGGGPRGTCVRGGGQGPGDCGLV